jgi:type IV pilus assembly protein PilB
LREFEIDPEVIALVPREAAIEHQVVPVNRAGGSLIVAMADPSNIVALGVLRRLTGYDIEVVVDSKSSIFDALRKYYSSEE